MKGRQLGLIGAQLGDAQWGLWQGNTSEVSYITLPDVWGVYWQMRVLLLYSEEPGQVRLTTYVANTITVFLWFYISFEPWLDLRSALCLVHGDPSSSCRDISIYRFYLQMSSLVMPIEGKPGDRESHKDSPFGHHDWLQPIKIVVEIFWSEPKGWIGWPTDRRCHR